MSTKEAVAWLLMVLVLSAGVCWVIANVGAFPEIGGGIRNDEDYCAGRFSVDRTAADSLLTMTFYKPCAEIVGAKLRASKR